MSEAIPSNNSTGEGTAKEKASVVDSSALSQKDEITQLRQQIDELNDAVRQGVYGAAAKAEELVPQMEGQIRALESSQKEEEAIEEATIMATSAEDIRSDQERRASFEAGERAKKEAALEEADAERLTIVDETKFRADKFYNELVKDQQWADQAKKNAGMFNRVLAKIGIKGSGQEGAQAIDEYQAAQERLEASKGRYCQAYNEYIQAEISNRPEAFKAINNDERGRKVLNFIMTERVVDAGVEGEKTSLFEGYNLKLKQLEAEKLDQAGPRTQKIIEGMKETGLATAGLLAKGAKKWNDLPKWFRLTCVPAAVAGSAILTGGAAVALGAIGVGAVKIGQKIATMEGTKRGSEAMAKKRQEVVEKGWKGTAEKVAQLKEQGGGYLELIKNQIDATISRQRRDTALLIGGTVLAGGGLGLALANLDDVMSLLGPSEASAFEIGKINFGTSQHIEGAGSGGAHETVADRATGAEEASSVKAETKEDIFGGHRTDRNLREEMRARMANRAEKLMGAKAQVAEAMPKVEGAPIAVEVKPGSSLLDEVQRATGADKNEAARIIAENVRDGNLDRGDLRVAPGDKVIFDGGKIEVNHPSGKLETNGENVLEGGSTQAKPESGILGGGKIQPEEIQDHQTKESLVDTKTEDLSDQKVDQATAKKPSVAEGPVPDRSMPYQDRLTASEKLGLGKTDARSLIIKANLNQLDPEVVEIIDLVKVSNGLPKSGENMADYLLRAKVKLTYSDVKKLASAVSLPFQKSI